MIIELVDNGSLIEAFSSVSIFTKHLIQPYQPHCRIATLPYTHISVLPCSCKTQQPYNRMVIGYNRIAM